MGRPAKFDQKKAGQILTALTEGNFLEDAAALVRVSRRTVERWIEKGRERAGKEETDEYAKFAMDVDHARAQFAFVSLRDIRSGTKRSDGLRWILERTRPRQFGERVQVHVQAEINGLLDKLQGALEPSVYNRVLEIITGEAGNREARQAASDGLGLQ